MKKSGENGDKCANDWLKIIGIDESKNKFTGIGPNDTVTSTDQVKICGQFPGTVVYTLKEALTELKMLFRVNEKATGQKRFGFRADMVIS